MIKNVVTAGYRIVASISDNNIINRKMFIELSGSDSLMPYIVKPVTKLDRYLLFDTVHLLKCIRNYWINQADKTFVYPDCHNNSSLKHESFLYLIT